MDMLLAAMAVALMNPSLTRVLTDTILPMDKDTVLN